MGTTTNNTGRRKESLSFPSDPLPVFPTTTRSQSRKTVALINQVSCVQGTGRGRREQERGSWKALCTPAKQCIKNRKLSTFPERVVSIDLMMFQSRKGIEQENRWEGPSNEEACLVLMGSGHFCLTSDWVQGWKAGSLRKRLPLKT